MKIKQTNADGVEEEIEVVTASEVEAKIAAEKAVIEEQFKTQTAEKDAEVTRLAGEKSKLEADLAQAKLDGMKEDHPNFKVLKEALNKKDEDIKAIKNELDSDKAQRVKEEMDSSIKILSKGDAELEKKIQFHLDKTLTGLKEGTKEERKVKLEAAYKLAADHSTDGPGMFDNGAGGGGHGGGGGGGEGSGVEFSAKERGLGGKLGITPEDYKKYGPRVSKR